VPIFLLLSWPFTVFGGSTVGALLGICCTESPDHQNTGEEEAETNFFNATYPNLPTFKC